MYYQDRARNTFNTDVFIRVYRQMGRFCSVLLYQSGPHYQDDMDVWGIPHVDPEVVKLAQGFPSIEYPDEEDKFLDPANIQAVRGLWKTREIQEICNQRQRFAVMEGAAR